jgi:hypothetical protein
MQGKIQLLLCNAPYFFQNGKRAPYRIGADAGEWLQPGGIHVSIFTARSDWDGRMINHWLAWYDQVRVWKLPDRTSPDDERAFEDYTQIRVVGVRRKTPATPTEADRKRLQGYQWKEPDRPEKSGWRYGSPPPELPTASLADPYVVPASREAPRLVVRNADEATLLGALDKSGAHLSPTWQQATTWPEEGYLGAPAMPYTGEAHIASEVMIGGLDGEIVWGPGSGSDAQPHLFTAFIGKEWVPMPVEDELKEKLREQGCVRVEMRQLMDKPILGVLNLQSGKSRYYQGEEVFEFLTPWIPTLDVRDHRSLKNFIAGVEECEDEVARLAALIRESQERNAERVAQAARRDFSHSIALRLVEGTRALVDWQPVFFRLLFDQVHHSASPQTSGKKKGGSPGSSLEDLANRAGARSVRLALASEGPITVEEIDCDAARGYDEVRDENGIVVGYQLGHQGRLLVPIYGIWSKRVTGYVDQQTGKVVTKKTCYDFRMPPAESFSPYEYLYAFFQGCVALSVIDESHNGRGRRTDIGHSHHYAMLAAHMRELTSGTHYGGDIIGFYHYWHRYHPQFWLSRGYGWNDAEKALSDYGVIQEWLKEYEREGDARRGSGKTDIYVSTVPAPGLSANLIPGLLEDLTYLTVLDVGAHMPPKQEIPRSISMKDPLLEQKKREADLEVTLARKQVAEIQAERSAMAQTPDGVIRQACLAQIDARLALAQERLSEASEQATSAAKWVTERDLAGAYARLVKTLEDLAREGNTAARLALGTVPAGSRRCPARAPSGSTTRSAATGATKGSRSWLLRRRCSRGTTCTLSSAGSSRPPARNSKPGAA